jgi:O-antigen/teichoic acid export membrane protein
MSIPRSVLSNWAGLVVNASLSFALTPILIHGLGDLDYGLWILGASMLDYLGLFDLGMRATVFRFVARLKGSGDRLTLNSTLASALGISLGIAILVLVATLGLLAYLPAFFGLTHTDGQTFRWVLLLLGVSAAALYPAHMLGTYLCAMRRFDLYNLVGVATSLLRALLIVGTLRVGGMVTAVAMITLATTLLSVLLYWRLLPVADPGVSVNWKVGSRAKARELTHFSLYSFLNSLGDFMRFYSHSVVIGRVLGVTLITPFSIATRLTYLWRQIVVGITSPLMGGMSELEGQSRETELRHLFLRTTSITTLLSLFIAVQLVLNGGAFIRFWVGDAFVSAQRFVLILTAGYLVSLSQQPSVDVVFVRGRHQLRGWLAIGEGLANILLSTYWANLYGLTGVAWGTTVPMLLVYALIQPWYALRIIGLSATSYLYALGRPLVVALVVLAAGFAGSSAAAPTLFSFIWMVTWQSLVFVLLSYIIVLTASERGRVVASGRRFALVFVRTVMGRSGRDHN